MGLWATWCSGSVLDHGQGVGSRWSSRFLPTQTIIWFYDSINVRNKSESRKLGKSWGCRLKFSLPYIEETNSFLPLFFNFNTHDHHSKISNCCEVETYVSKFQVNSLQIVHTEIRSPDSSVMNVHFVTLSSYPKAFQARLWHLLGFLTTKHLLIWIKKQKRHFLSFFSLVLYRRITHQKPCCNMVSSSCPQLENEYPCAS